MQKIQGWHTYDSIATELDNIHSSHSLSHKIIATIIDNGSNFIKAFQMYKPHMEDSEDKDSEDEMTFTNIGDVLLNVADDDDDVISLPPNQRCA